MIVSGTVAAGIIFALCAALIWGFIGWSRAARLRSRITGAELAAKKQGLVSKQGAGASFEDFFDRLAGELKRSRDSAALKDLVLTSMSEGVVMLDHSGTPVYANPAAERLLGAGAILPRQVLDQKTVEFTVRGPAIRELKAVSEALPGGRRLAVIQDVTESKRIDSVRRDFVANVSHELKTPVAGILASAETLEMLAGETKGDTARFAGSLVRDARRLSRLIGDLLDLARLEQVPTAFDEVDVSEVVTAEVARAQTLAGEKSLDFEFEISPGLKVVGVKQDLILAVGNLLENALRYTEKGRLSVRLESVGAEVIFSVADSGVGIPAKDLPRIFERFYRVDKARSSQTGGTGLGLSIVKHAAERHGGDVHATSELGRGSRFVLSLPLSIEPSGANPVPPAGNPAC